MTITTEYFIKEAKEIHGDKYNYSLVKNADLFSEVMIICPEHGEFIQLSFDHIVGHGCPLCAKTPQTERFIAKAKLKHGDKYDYSLVDYHGSSQKVKIICIKHGIFQQTPNSHLSKHGCPSCSKYGFDPNKPSTLYYFSIPDIHDDSKLLYKIGVINTSLVERYHKQDYSRILNIRKGFFQDGQQAYNEEQRLIKKYKNYLWKGETPFTDGTGINELFTIDISKIDDNFCNLCKVYKID